MASKFLSPTPECEHESAVEYRFEADSPMLNKGHRETTTAGLPVFVECPDCHATARIGWGWF